MSEFMDAMKNDGIVHFTGHGIGGKIALEVKSSSF
jgi:hypothetical protein